MGKVGRTTLLDDLLFVGHTTLLDDLLFVGRTTLLDDLLFGRRLLWCNGFDVNMNPIEVGRTIFFISIVKYDLGDVGMFTEVDAIFPAL